MAEMRLGAGRGVPGTVLLLTIGTGIGSGLFVDGRLVPNTELGHLEFRGKDAETRAVGRGARAAPAALEGVGARSSTCTSAGSSSTSGRT